MDSFPGPEKGQKMIMVEGRATANSFYSALSEYHLKPKDLSPQERLVAELKRLERSAHRGDLKAWQERFPLVLRQAEILSQDPLKELEFRVHLKKLELVLLLAARKRVQQQARMLGQKTSPSFTKQAEKLGELGKKLEEQILAKTS